MRIIGDDGNVYRTEKECRDADKAYAAKLEADALAKAAEKAELEKKVEDEQKRVSQRKKELSAKIEATQLAYEEAQKLYGLTKTKASEQLKEAKKAASAIIKEAEEKAEMEYKKVEDEVDNLMLAVSKQLEEASHKRMEAISEFNKEFGPYKTVLTGTKALDECKWAKQVIDDFFNNCLTSTIFKNF